MNNKKTRPREITEGKKTTKEISGKKLAETEGKVTYIGGQMGQRQTKGKEKTKGDKPRKR